MSPYQFPGRSTGVLRFPLPSPRPLQILQRPRHGDTRDDDHAWRDRANVVLPRMPEGMAADAQRDQGCRAASGTFQPLIKTRPATAFELPVAGILFALRPAEPDQPGFRVAESDADARKRQCSDSAGGKEVGREAFFPRLPAGNRAIELRAPSLEPIDRVSRPGEQVPSHGRARIRTHHNECNIELARAHHVAGWRAALRAVDVVRRP